MLVYAVKEGTVIWSDHRSVHKAGRVPKGQSLTVISTKVGGWYSIDRPANLSLPGDPMYPKYWVKVSDTVETIIVPDQGPVLDPIPAPLGTVTDMSAAVALLTIMKWWKQQ